MSKASISYPFPKGEWKVFVFDHHCNLSPHSGSKQHHPIEEENRPKHGHVNYGKEGQHEANQESIHQ